MPLKVIGAGFGRTGTMSVHKALNELGIPCYHMAEVFKHGSHIDFWNTVAHAPAGAQHDWEIVLANYVAAVDNPTACVWRELCAAYPEAKVLLTVHPKGARAWYQSTMDTIYRLHTQWEFRFLGLFFPPVRKLIDMANRLVWQRGHAGTMVEPARAIAFYDAHIEHVRAAVPSERLLVFSVDQGWEPLCKFLGVPVPDTPFPNVNDRKQVVRMLLGIRLAAYAALILIAACVTALIRMATA